MSVRECASFQIDNEVQLHTCGKVSSFQFKCTFKEVFFSFEQLSPHVENIAAWSKVRRFVCQITPHIVIELASLHQQKLSFTEKNNKKKLTELLSVRAGESTRNLCTQADLILRIWKTKKKKKIGRLQETKENLKPSLKAFRVSEFPFLLESVEVVLVHV
jgi:hypothetical protein